MRSLRWLPWLAALLVVAVYLPALSASFQFDDWQVVLGDARVASLAAWWESMPGMRALVKLTYALNHSLGAQVEGFRAVNIALHACNTALVFFLVRDLSRRLRTADAGGASLVAAVTALVFALHPVQTESVTYIAARPNLIAALFSLLALLAWLRGRQRQTWLRWPLAALCYVAALAGKETAAVLPLAMLLCLAAERSVTRRDVLFPAALVLLFFALMTALWSWLPYDYLLRTSLQTRGPLENLLTQAEGVTWLAGQLLRWDLLNADPMLAPVTTITLGGVLRTGVLLAVLAAGVLCLRRLPAVGFGILWFFLWLAPTNSLLARLDVANDRQLYLALMGPGWCVAHLFLQLKARAWIATLLLAMVLAAGTWTRNRVYQTEIGFWQDVTAKSPHNARAWNNLGMALAGECRAQAAADAFREASRLAPDDPLAEINLALLEQGELDVAGHCPGRSLP
jgi:tetratricopeptide (TPR) repeat protein